MYKILVVDDEPRVSAGIRNFLLTSELNITEVETAINGFEAIDYLRMDHYDLVLTDIQMGRMSGIELMENIYMEQWNVPVIVISAHEKFDFAKKSLRLGAKDYLVKPVERTELLRVVRKALTQKELPVTSPQAEHHHIREHSRRDEWLMELVTEPNLTPQDIQEITGELGGLLQGPYFGVITIRIDYSQAGFSRQQVTLHDRKLLKYAALNIMNETLSEWDGITFNGFGHSIISIIQLSAEDMGDPQVRVHSQIQMIGQMIAMNLKQHLNAEAIIGLSTLGGGISTLPGLLEEADTAAGRSTVHPGQKVFYYGDIAMQEQLSRGKQEPDSAQQQPLQDPDGDPSVISRITSYIQNHYRNPALKIQDISEEVHFSAAHLGYIFKREMKTNLWDYVTTLRMEEAKRLMMATDKKRYEVAYAVGYESPEHFSRMFKRVLGLTPAEFRKQARGGDRAEAET
ncbi:response regulator [Paenibacillus tritici]|uniref:Response regulator n=1 Tax=Paenibacillus tritici TaxID=1873425 RepID=A0ABX2DIA5_9BACL|nr:response regulator [Paenibacillus tritici]NQX44352.1 response regulator [Paenibacillus tritici]